MLMEKAEKPDSHDENFKAFVIDASHT